MTSSSQNLNIKGTHGGFDVRAGGDEKQKINFAWPNIAHYSYNYMVKDHCFHACTGGFTSSPGSPLRLAMGYFCI